MTKQRQSKLTNNVRDTEKRKHLLDWLALVIAVLAFGSSIFQGWVARDAENRQLRTYVGLLPGNIENFGDIKEQKFTFIRKNYGQTPANDVQVTEFGESIISIGQAIPLNPLKSPPDMLRGAVTLFPSSELRMSIIGLPMDKTFVDKLSKNDDMRFVYLGTVKYRDAFDAVHYTNFCWMFKSSDLIGNNADWCQSHNDSD